MDRTNTVRRLQRARREGLLRTLRSIASRGVHELVLREEHIWYELLLQDDRRRRPMPAGLVLVEADQRQRRLAAQMEGGPGRRQLDEFSRVGGQLWVVLDGERAAFTCWIFPKLAPALAAPGGWLELPAGTVCLEDSATSPDHRGRGIAPAAWSRIADVMADRGTASVITKVAVDNVPSRRAVTKAGFTEVAQMRLLRVGGRNLVRVKPLGTSMSAQLAERLDRGRPAGPPASGPRRTRHPSHVASRGVPLRRGVRPCR
jgi:ribosomal protein S18 acetylase RimI-like enzyme